jgi:hypothetical protein
MCLIMSGAAVPAVAGPYEDALASYDKGDYVTTLRVWRPFAEQGDPTPRTARTSNPASICTLELASSSWLLDWSPNDLEQQVVQAIDPLFDGGEVFRRS